MRSSWVSWAVSVVRSCQAHDETPLLEVALPAELRARLLLKDESQHPSGSLKHRLAGSLIMFGLCNGDIRPGGTLVDASSGSTAISEAYFARELGLDFVAVVPTSTSPRKLRALEELGARCELVAGGVSVTAVAERLARTPGWVYLDQFANASVRTNWREGNVASALFGQLDERGLGCPDWVVVGAGTGGTSATVARFARYRGRSTSVAVVDPEGSAFYPAWLSGNRGATGAASRIEGIGRAVVEASFMPQLIDEVIPVPDLWSIAGMRALRQVGIVAGPSTGANLLGCLTLALRQGRSEPLTVASLICDRGDRYVDTYDDDAWLAQQGLVLGSEVDDLVAFLRGGAAPVWLADGRSIVGA